MASLQHFTATDQTTTSQWRVVRQARSERRFQLHFGSRLLVSIATARQYAEAEATTERPIATRRIATSRTANRTGWGRAIALVLLAGAAIAAIARPDFGAGVRRHSLTIGLPEPAMPVVAVANRDPARASRPVPAAPAVDNPMTVRQPAPVPPTISPVAQSPAEAPKAAGGDVARALAAAFATGDVQDWSDGSASGVVVVGPAQPGAAGSCRDVAILSRGEGGTSHTENSRQCDSATGTITPTR